MKGSGNWGPLHLSTRIRQYLDYKAWKNGIIVIEVHATGISTNCARCGADTVWTQSMKGRTKQTEHQYEKQADGLTLWHVRKQMS